MSERRLATQGASVPSDDVRCRCEFQSETSAVPGLAPGWEGVTVPFVIVQVSRARDRPKTAEVDLRGQRR